MKSILREEFLKEFIKAVILEKRRLLKNMEQMEMSRIPPMIMPPQKMIAQAIRPQIIRKRTITRHTIQKIVQQKPFQNPASAMPAPAISSAVQQKKPAEIKTLSRIEQLLVDPAVLSVECPGPTKHLLMNRGGAIQTANITLSIEEINNIMGEISDRTRIPILPGIFRAALGNYTITAIISEFAGTRFIIQKRYLSTAPKRL
ncbi:MAG: hypothetical protein Q8L29_03330 [archaeon]|nr:hypothetical protein [archaeon]